MEYLRNLLYAIGIVLFFVIISGMAIGGTIALCFEHYITGAILIFVFFVLLVFIAITFD